MLFKCSGHGFQICLESEEHWKECPEVKEDFESELRRGPANLGPARRVAESSVLLVISKTKQ